MHNEYESYTALSEYTHTHTVYMGTIPCVIVYHNMVLGKVKVILVKQTESSVCTLRMKIAA